jgi:UDP-GlcNAc:undecaprenyl-phosphate GlcNAc-1-phosphate transferase
MFSKLIKSKNLIFIFVNFALVLFQVFLILFFYKEIHQEIPLWYTKNWGLEILTNKSNILIIPIVSTLISLFCYFLVKFSEKYYQYLFHEVVFYFSVILNLVLTFSLTQIIKKTTFSNLFFLDYVGSELLNSFFIAFIITLGITPYFIKLYEKYGLITDPKKHQHPGMLLKNPSARGGGLIFALGFSITALISSKLSPIIISIIIASVIAAVIGILDDLSNTSLNKKYKFFGNPVFRLLFLLPIPVIILIYSGITIKSISNPFNNGVIDLASTTFNFMGNAITPFVYLFTFFWILWLINLLSWSNGVDGQYSGIITIAGITISFLALRFIPLSEYEINISKLAIITAGASLGLTPYTWNPSKIMWGFGATSAGIVLAALSIIAATKVSISVLVLLVPFMDGVITVIRRILNKQNPLKGDRSHLHHLLLQRGWSIKQVAIFYWITTAILGFIGYFSSDKDLPLLILTLGGIVGFLIALLNFRFKA